MLSLKYNILLSKCRNTHINLLLLIHNTYSYKPISNIYIYIYIGFKTFFYVVRHLYSIASYLPTGLHLGFFRSWPSLCLPPSFSSVFLVLCFVSASTSKLFWVIFLLPFFEHGRTMQAVSVQFLI